MSGSTLIYCKIVITQKRVTCILWEGNKSKIFINFVYKNKESSLITSKGISLEYV